ncbi:DUF3224 domain-containing protein [Rhodococcus aerolatus]
MSRSFKTPARRGDQGGATTTTQEDDVRLDGEMETVEWSETTWAGEDHTAVSGPKQTTAVVRTRWTGDVTGDGEQRWLMTYLSDDHAEFVGLETVIGTYDGRPCSVALTHRGAYRDGGVRSASAVVEGSGTGSLQGWTGAGLLEFGGGADHRSRWSVGG